VVHTDSIIDRRAQKMG